MTHRDAVQNYTGTLAELAEDIGNLRYDALAELLQLLSVKIGQDGQKDAGRGRAQLAAALQDSAKELAASAGHIERAWRVAKPFMPEDKPTRG